MNYEIFINEFPIVQKFFQKFHSSMVRSSPGIKQVHNCETNVVGPVDELFMHVYKLTNRLHAW